MMLPSLEIEDAVISTKCLNAMLKEPELLPQGHNPHDN